MGVWAGRGSMVARGFKGKIQSLLDVLRRLEVKHSGIKACPRCGCVSLRPSSYLDAWLTPEMYHCPSCGYRGPIAMELEDDR